MRKFGHPHPSGMCQENINILLCSHHGTFYCTLLRHYILRYIIKFYFQAALASHPLNYITLMSSTPQVAPYGTWSSPITSDVLAAGIVSLNEVLVNVSETLLVE